jgi:hypothetical protein
MTGSFTMDFYAPGDFDGYVGDEVIDTETFTGPIGGENPSTGGWVAAHFSGVIQTTGLNND